MENARTLNTDYAPMSTGTFVRQKGKAGVAPSGGGGIEHFVRLINWEAS